jgi:hypothetical protein
MEEVQEQWDNMKSLLHDICNTNLKSERPDKMKYWMTDHILQLMDERRKSKNNPAQYRNLQRLIRNEIRKAKEDWMKCQCEELESYDRSHNTFKMHKKLKELTGTNRKHTPSCLLDDSSNLILDEKEIMVTWEKYIFDTFRDDRPAIRIFNDNELNGPPILNSEILHAIHTSENRKACGPDEIPVEVLKLISDDNIEYLLRLFNAIYDTWNIPQDWLRSTFVTLQETTPEKVQ